MFVGKIGVQNTPFKSLDFSRLDKQSLTNEQCVSLMLLSEEIQKQGLDRDFYFEFSEPPKGALEDKVNLTMIWEASDDVSKNILVTLNSGYEYFKSNLEKIRQSRFQIKQEVLLAQKPDSSAFDIWG